MSIYKRKSGRYEVRVDLEPTATGLRRRKSVGMFRTRKQAKPPNARRCLREIAASISILRR